jgi:diguanylate cyclase (GGDEF)-like protein
MSSTALPFDMRTIALCIACSNAVLLATLWAYGRSAALNATGRLWAAARVMQLIGWIMLVLRGSIPDGVSIPLTNIGLMVGLGLEMAAAWSLLGMPRWRQVSSVALGIVGLLLAIVLVAGVGATGRIIMLSSVLCVFYVLTGAAFLWRREHGSPVHTLLAVTNLVMAVVAALRAGWAWRAEDVTVFQSSPFQLYAFMGYFALMHFNAFGFLALTKLGVERELQRAATRDPLTGALNRRGFMELAGKQWELSRRLRQPLVVLMIDADRFKQVNDRYGHAVGDQVLALLSQCIQGGVRASDSVARLGGDEFIALLNGAGRQGALQVAERIRASFEAAAATIAAQPVAATISIGVAVSEAGDGHVDDVIRRADVCVYQAKKDGTNRVCSDTPPQPPMQLPAYTGASSKA